MLFNTKFNATLLAFTATTLFGFIAAQTQGSKDLFRCKQNCYHKFVQDWHHCMDFEDCKNMCITPPNINSYIPEAFSFLCWNNCDQQLGPFLLNINSALRQGSLVLTDIAWDQAITNASKQCLVTWEVSGGGLMGNLLTDSSTVELSLWSDTIYNVQVTCKHKETGGMRRSYQLIVDTHKLGESAATGMQAIAMETPMGKGLPNIYGGDQNTISGETETDSRMRILKDSSKDFMSPYNPNAEKASSAQSSQTSTTDINSVLRNKLASSPTHSDAMPAFALNQSILFAMVGALFVFFVLLALFVLTRSRSKEVPACAHNVDKEVLIHSEMLPSQTPTAKVAHGTPVFTPAPDSRTLHV